MQLGRLALLALSFLLPLGAARAAPAPQCSSGPPTAIGNVSVLGTGFPGTGRLPRSTIDVLRVDCAGLPPMGVSLQISEPDPAGPFRGTLLVASGALGIDYYSTSSFGLPVIQRLQALGFRIVERAWTPSWLSLNLSMKKQSCLFGTVVHWVHQNRHTTGVFGTLGSSGGALEIAFALSTWNAGDVLDLAVLTGGPPGSRFDLQCPVPLSAGWLAQCAQLFPPNVMECPQPSCQTPGGFNLCVMCSQNATLAEWREDSVLHSNAVTDYPDTFVYQVTGAADCLGAVASGLLFHQAVTSEIVLEFVPGTPHSVAQSTQGQDAVVRAVLSGAAQIPRPATLAFQAWPRLGGTLDLDLHGQPGDPYFVLWSLGTGNLEVPFFGWLFLTPPLFVIGSGTLNTGSGRATSTLPISVNPALTGFEIYAQAIVGRSLTNLVRFEIVP